MNLLRFSQKEREIQEPAVEELLKGDLIERTNSPWNTRAVLVRKPDGNWRFCIDYRQLNEILEVPTTPLPKIEEAISVVGSGKHFSTMDLTSGFFQVMLEESSRSMTAFTSSSGQYRWKRLPMGAASSAQVFQGLMMEVLHQYLWKDLVVYMDDIIVFHKEAKQHVQL